MSQSLRRLAWLLGLAAVYYFGAKLGLRFAYINSSVTTIWPPAGIALAAFVLFGYRVWPAIFGAAFLANFTTTGAVLPSLGIAIGNTIEGLLAAYLVNRFARGGRVFDRVRDILRFALLAALVSTTVAASIGVASLAFGGLLSWSDAPRVWLTWWLGDAVGDIVIAPVLILWIGVKPAPGWGRRQTLEGIAAALITGLVTFAIFGGLFPARHYSITMLLWPVMIWVAFRFGPRETATAILVVSIIAISRTLQGFGPYGHLSVGESLTLLQVWTGITAVTSLVLSAVVASQREIQGTWRQLAVTDQERSRHFYESYFGALVRDQALAPHRPAAGGGPARPGRPEADQRPPRPPGRQPGDSPGGRGAAGILPRDRYGGAVRRRRVRARAPRDGGGGRLARGAWRRRPAGDGCREAEYLHQRGGSRVPRPR